MLVLIAGLPGSGKTTLAQAYAERFAAEHINSDSVRKALGLMGHYEPADKATVYETLFQSAEKALRQGKTVLVDSTFYQKALRDAFENLARRCGVPAYWIETRADEKTLLERVGRPRPDSEADVAVYQKIRDAFEAIEADHLVIWTDRTPLDTAVDMVRLYLQQHKT